MSTRFVYPVGRRRQKHFKSRSITAKRDAYMKAGEPYGRNRKGMKRWLRESRVGGRVNPYAYVQIPVMLACNDDRGEFDGNVRMVHIHDALELESHYIDEESFEPSGVECSLASANGMSCLVIGAEVFPY